MDRKEKSFNINAKISKKIILRMAINFFDIWFPPEKSNVCILIIHCFLRVLIINRIVFLI